MFGEMLSFLVLWLAVFATCGIIVGTQLFFDGRSNVVGRAATAGVAVATMVTAVGIVIRLAVFALDHIPG